MTRPWKARAAELESKEGPYSDYAAWREWYSAKESKLIGDGGDLLGEADYDDVINLYLIFCDTYGKLDEENARLRGLIDQALQAPAWPDCLSILHDALAGVTGADDPRVVARVNGSVQP